MSTTVMICADGSSDWAGLPVAVVRIQSNDFGTAA
jgi:hypothetical protein